MLSVDSYKSFHGCIIDGEKIYFHTHSGVVVEGNAVNMDMSVSEIYEEDELINRYPSERIILNNGFAYFFCDNYEYIIVRDCSRACSEILLDFRKEKNMRRRVNKYNAVKCINNCIYIFVDNQDGYYVVRDYLIEFKRYPQLSSDLNWTSVNILSCDNNNSIFFYFGDSGRLLYFNFITEDWNECGFKIDVQNVISIQSIENSLYFWGAGEKSCCYNLLTGEKRFINIPSGCLNNKWDHLYYVSDVLYFIPGANDSIIRMRFNNGIVSETSVLDYPLDIQCVLDEDERALFNKYREYCEDDEWRYYSARYYNYMFLMRGDGTPYDILYNLVNGNKVIYPLGVWALFLVYIFVFYSIYFFITKKQKDVNPPKIQ